MENGDAQAFVSGIQQARPWLSRKQSLSLSRYTYSFPFFSWKAWTAKIKWTNQSLNRS